MAKRNGTEPMDFGPKFRAMVAEVRAKYPDPVGGLGILRKPRGSFLDELERRMKERAAEAITKTKKARKKK